MPNGTTLQTDSRPRCCRGQSNIDTSQPYAFSIYDAHAPHCSKGWPWPKPNDPTVCSVLNVTKQASEERFADEMGGVKGLIRLMVVPNQVAGLNYTATPAAELANVPDAPLCQPTQVDPFVECSWYTSNLSVLVICGSCDSWSFLTDCLRLQSQTL